MIMQKIMIINNNEVKPSHSEMTMQYEIKIVQQFMNIPRDFCLEVKIFTCKLLPSARPDSFIILVALQLASY